MGTPAEGAPRAAYLALVLGAFALRALVALDAGGSPLLAVPVGDEAVFDAWARRIAAGRDGEPGVLWQAPGAAWWLGAWYALVGPGPGLLAGRLLHAALGAATALLLADLGRRLVGRRTGLAAGWLFALYPPAVFFGVRLGKPASATLLLVAALHLTVCHRARPRALLALAAGLVLALAALTRESLVVVAPLVVLALWRAGRGRAAGCALAGLALGAAPLVARNLAAGAPPLAYTANLGPNLWIGNHEGADGLYTAMRPGRGGPGFERRDARALAERETGRALDAGQVSAFWRDEALGWAAAHPLAAARLTLEKARLLVHATEWMDSVSYAAARGESAWLRWLGVPLRYGVLLPLALAGVLLAGARRRALWLPVIAPAALVLAAHLPFFVFGRFRAPVLPLLALLAVVGCRELLSRRHPAARKALIAAGALALIAHLPVRAGESARATSWSNVGSALLAAGRQDEARSAFQRAVEADPAHPNARFGLGQTLALGGDLDGAEPHLSEAIRLAPRYELDARLVVVEGLLVRGDEERARSELEPAALMAGLDADASHRVGRLWRGLGESTRAITHYRRALLLDRGHAQAANDLGFLQWTFGEWAEAVAAFEQALDAEPSLRPALINLAGLLASFPDDAARDGARALALARRARRAGASAAVALDLEGMALAELGRFDEAAAAADRAAAAARAEGRAVFATEIEARGALYRAGRPFRSG